jgi:hypothetical protein
MTMDSNEMKLWKCLYRRYNGSVEGKTVGKPW